LPKEGGGALPLLFGPAPAGEEMIPWLAEQLARIVRAQNLLQVAQRFEREQRGRRSALSLSLELLRFDDESDRQGKAVIWQSGGIRFQPGDLLGVRLRNQSREAADVTLLFIDSNYGISPLFPASETIDNRLRRIDPPLLLRYRVNDDSLGLEHLVLIAVKAQPMTPFAHFTFLAQPSLERARSASPGDAERTVDSPLGSLFQSAVFGSPDGQRGILKAAAASYALRAIHFEVIPISSQQAAVGDSSTTASLRGTMSQTP
jgi:hypothetical protein